MSDITAAVGIAQLRKLDRIIERKRKLAKYWDEKLQDERINRNKLIEMLMKKGVQTQIGAYACHIQPVYNSILLINALTHWIYLIGL